MSVPYFDLSSTGGGYATPVRPETWLDQVAPYYSRMIGEWRYSRDHYSADVLKTSKVSQYLVRKMVGETPEAYEERVRLADYTPHFSAVVDALAGMLSRAEPDATRVFGDALGDPHEPTAPIGRLWLDADGAGNGWLTLWQMLATDLVVVHDAWVMVDGGADGSRPRIRVIEAERVTNWIERDGVLVEALVCEPETDVRSSVQDPTGAVGEGEEKQWVRLTLDGWERWHKVKATATSGGAAQSGSCKPEMLSSGAWAYETRDGRPTIPLVRVQLPLRRNVGYSLARKANALFNKESERDHLLRYSAFPILNIFANDTGFKKVVQALREGARVLQVPPGGQPHSFAAPDVAPAAILNQTLQAKTADFYAVALREYGAASRGGRDRVTATEIANDTASGVAAFLGLLKHSIDNSENIVIHLLEQTIWPNDKSKWAMGSVSRSGDFMPIDSNAVIERLRTRYLGPQAVVPVGRTALIEAVTQIAAWDGLDADPNEIAAAVDASLAVAPSPVEMAPVPGLKGIVDAPPSGAPVAEAKA